MWTRNFPKTICLLGLAAVPAEFLSEDWCQATLEAAECLPSLADMSARVNFEIAGAKPSKRFHAVVEDGRLVALGEGKLDEADCLVSCKLADAWAIVCGEARAEVGFMHGWLKLEGDYGILVFGLRPLYEQEQWQDFKQAVAERTAAKQDKAERRS